MKGQGKFYVISMLVFVLVAGMQVAAQTSSCVNPQSGTIAWWTGDNTVADYFNTSDGLASPPVSFTTGEVGGAFLFDGLQSTYVRIPRTDVLESMTLAVSVEAWVNSAGPGPFKYIFSKGANNNGASYALETDANGGLLFYVSDGQNFYKSPEAAAAAIWDGLWHHVVGTFDGSFVHLYVDGQEVGATSAPGAVIGYNLSVTNDAFIGTFNGDPGFFSFLGQIDEVAVLNRALSLSEIQAIFNAGTAGMCKVIEPINTGARGMGFWQNKNGQGMIAGGASTAGVCNSGTWLRQYAPYQDLAANATCSQVATYAYSVVKGATGTNNMNAKLKSQMLATAMSTYFSDPTLGGNKIGAPKPIGGVAINVSGASVAFGGAIALNVSDMLTYAGGQSNVGGSIWYGNVKAVQEPAKNMFDSINSGLAFAP